MAWYDDIWNAFDPDDHRFFDSSFEKEQWENLVNTFSDPELAGDQDAAFMYHVAYFDFSLSQYERDLVRNGFYEYLSQNYDIDAGDFFIEEFDWEGYREWYEETQ